MTRFGAPLVSLEIAMQNDITTWRKRLFGSISVPGPFADLVAGMEKDRKLSIGKLRPWAWWVEVARGCNLRCGFCATRLFPPGEYSFMSPETWEHLLDVVSVVSPICRLEIGNAGEPTLNPHLPALLRRARERVPTLQLMLYTNGTTLIDGRTTYQELFEAGLNVAFVDMYAPREKHITLAAASGYRYQEQRAKTTGSVNVFTYHGNPDLHVIQLSDHPGNWPRRKVSRGAFSTFFNNLDWEAAARYGLRPVKHPPRRRCDLPSKFPNVYWDGSYTFCCFDFMREVAGSLGNVSDGVGGFFRYWLGKYMQDCRRLLYLKRRDAHPMCRRCAFTSVRGDIPRWNEDLLQHWWDGRSWQPLPPLPAPEGNVGIMGMLEKSL